MKLDPPQQAAFAAMEIAGFDGKNIEPMFLVVCSLTDIANSAGYRYTDLATMFRKLADRLDEFAEHGDTLQ